MPCGTFAGFQRVKVKTWGDYYKCVKCLSIDGIAQEWKKIYILKIYIYLGIYLLYFIVKYNDK